MTRRDATTLFDDYRIADADLEGGGLTAQALRNVAAGLEPLTSLVRRGTLEDVFLHLTGRRLED